MKKNRLIVLLAVLCLTILFSNTSQAAKRPAKVGKFKVTKVSENAVSFSWKKVKSCKGYMIYMSGKSKGKYKCVYSGKNTKTKCKVGKLSANKTYYFKIRAYKKFRKTLIYSKYSKVIKVTTKKSSKEATSENANTSEATTQDSNKTSENSSEKTTSSTESSSEKTTEESIEEKKLSSYVQDMDYKEITDTILNPDQGFYRTRVLKVTQSGIDSFSDKIFDNDPDHNLYHLRVDISALSEKVNNTADIEVPDMAITQFKKLFDAAYKNNKSIIIRFCYAPDFGNTANNEPSVEMMESHIAKLGAAINEYPDVITAVEAGMLGPWGEMHTSDIAYDTSVNNKIIDAWLNATKTGNIPVLVRTPDRIYQYVGIPVNFRKKDGVHSFASGTSEALKNTVLTPQDDGYRVGLYNDGYRGSDSDQGTYADNKHDEELAWVAKQSAHLPYGGEVTIPSSEYHHIDKCVGDMKASHLSYLDYEWDTTVVQTQWASKQTYTEASGDDKLYYGKSAFTYIQNHMGYRFVLKKSTLSYDEERTVVKANLEFVNVGFGNLNRVKSATLLFVDEQGNEIRKDAGTFTGKDNEEFVVSFREGEIISDKNYKVYLLVDNGKGHYPIRFSNNLWDNQYKANLIGNVIKK